LKAVWSPSAIARASWGIVTGAAYSCALAILPFLGVEQEKERNNNILRVLAAKISRLRELLSENGIDSEKKAKMETLLKKLEDEQQKAQKRVSELLGRLNSFGNAVVEVKGEIAPGTLIEICQTALFVTEPLKKVRVRLGRERDKLITESL